MKRSWIVCGFACLALLGASPAAAAESAATVDSTAIGTPMVLTAAKLTGFFDAVDALRGMGVDGVAASYDPKKPGAFATSMQVEGDAQAVLSKHGFADVAEFQRVAFNAAIAYSVLERGGRAKVDADLEKAKVAQARAIAELGKHLSPEQLKAMSAQSQEGMAAAIKLHDVPPENLVLMKQFAPRMRALERKSTAPLAAPAAR